MDRDRKLVVEELLTKPSDVCPTLFVGLGGCGCRMVSRVAEHLAKRPDWEERYKALVKFALVDTNVNDLESQRENADETFLISDFEKEEYADLASGKLFLDPDRYFTQWVPQNYRFRAGDTAGAGQIRIEARLGVFYQMKHKDFVPKFRRLLEQLKRHEHGHRRLDTQEIRIVVCFSVAGGTGSGAHLPIAYMLRDLARELGKPTILGVAVLPAVFEELTGVNKDGTYANGYAALKEVEHLMKLGSPDSRFFPEEGLELHYDPSQPARVKVRQKPFEFVYIVDKPESFSVEDPVKAAADALYLQLFSPLFGVQAGDYDNYTQHQRFLVPHDFEGKGIVGFTSFYGSYGAAVLLVPVDGLVEYCSKEAALSLMRASFVRSIPGEPIYQTLRAAQDTFDEVTLGRTENEKPIHISEFEKKPAPDQERLLDRLYMKRVRLLAACEARAGESKSYLELFYHGHLPGEVPEHDGSYDTNQKAVAAGQQRLVDGGMGYSIASLILPAVKSTTAGKLPGLLARARRAIEEAAEAQRAGSPGKVRAGELRMRAAAWEDEFKRVGRSILNDGYREATLRYPGFDKLVDLAFLEEEAAEVDLAAKRFAVCSILEQVDFNLRRKEERESRPEPEGDDQEIDDSKKLDEKAAAELARRLEERAIERAMAALTREFGERLGDFQDSLKGYATVQRRLEGGFDDLERDQSRRLSDLRSKGDDSANRYELDAEALQMEDGRRLWDFFYEDRVANDPELSLSDKGVQRVLSETVTDLALRGRGTTTSTLLARMFKELQKYAREKLQPRIGGDPHSSDETRRDGLTLAEALELEVVYRALRRSHAERIEMEGRKAISEVVAQYRHLPEERKIKIDDPDVPRYRDYLRDKIKRLVKEKASLLCVYDESRDLQGGVRPDRVFLAAIDGRLKDTAAGEAIQSADSGLTWVSTGWHNPKEVIVYRAVLNVPLYVFGRMNDMRAEYHRFRNLAKRPKVLHIDRNWEYSLPDLDPESAKETHRQKILRNHVINFAALFSSGRQGPDGNGEGGAAFVVRRNGSYEL
ncbi:MAG TPA: tubulin-like doman-containing protein, partial [Thermoanaerobaculia bacterium]|nr:tubulin-like doman-containing protein [Thermoanaerobaculia bacterium]